MVESSILSAATNIMAVKYAEDLAELTIKIVTAVSEEVLLPTEKQYELEGVIFDILDKELELDYKHQMG